MFIAQMVGRNESKRFLVPVLDRLSNQVDKIIFTDDCSDDETPLIAEEYGAHVYRMPEPTFTQHEGRLRMAAWENLCNHATVGDWILAIDCDEMFYPTERLGDWMEQKKYDVLSITFYHMWNETDYRIDKAWAPTRSSRMFRFQEGGTYRDRRMACGAEPTYVEQLIRQRKIALHTNFRMKHLGYVNDHDKEMKYERYSILDGGDFHSLRHIESIVDGIVGLAEWVD